jgi:hypothetical protein
METEIRVAIHSHGQGDETTFAQIAHEITGVALDRIKTLQGDTLYAPFSTGTWGSRALECLEAAGPDHSDRPQGRASDRDQGRVDLRGWAH